MHVMTEALEGVIDPACLMAWVLWIPILRWLPEAGELWSWWKTPLITIATGIKVAQVVAANAVPQVEAALGTLAKLDEIQGIQQTRMSIE